MAMGAVQAVNIQTGTPEGPKYLALGDTIEVWQAAVTTALATGDTISGPIIPRNCYLLDCTVDVGNIGAGATFTFGYQGTPAAFIAAGAPNTFNRMNVAGALGYVSATANTTTLVTMAGTAGTPVAGTIKIAIQYLASP